MNDVKIAALLRNININLNVYTTFEPCYDEEFECQAQFFLKKSNGVCLVTNVLKVKFKNGTYLMEGFGKINAPDFGKVKMWGKVENKERGIECLND